jgi:hypothetical protein
LLFIKKKKKEEEEEEERKQTKTFTTVKGKNGTLCHLVVDHQGVETFPGWLTDSISPWVGHMFKLCS